MHRLLQLLITQPGLLVEHATAYAELASTDAKLVADASQHRLLWSAALLCCLSVAGVLAGVALMLWITAPEETLRMPWMLIVIPLAPICAAVVCYRMLKSKECVPAFAKVREQLAADIQMLREVNLP
jgi:uncharacterized membrane protein YqjE